MVCSASGLLSAQSQAYKTVGIDSCQESVEWNGGMKYWNGILEWNTGITFDLITIKIMKS